MGVVRLFLILVVAVCHGRIFVPIDTGWALLGHSAGHAVMLLGIVLGAALVHRAIEVPATRTMRWLLRARGHLAPLVPKENAPEGA